MLKSLYRKLAGITLNKNRENYLPFILTIVGITAMQLIIHAMYKSPDLSGFAGMNAMQTVLQLALYVNGIFSLIFIFYTNNFLTRRRKKEFALYNMLGMEKKHIIKILAWETVFSGIAGIGGGIFLGSLLYKFTEGIFFKLIDVKFKGSYLPPTEAVINTATMFTVIFLINFISSAVQIYMTKPADMMRQSREGEKPPKVNPIYAVIGILGLVSGYWLAIRCESPLKALSNFFIAVLLVMIGTYFSFRALSIFIIKLLQKNKNYYYKPAHFTGVSGLMFRMKQNATGLANICLLSTAVLVIMSSAICFYLGNDTVIHHRFPRHILMSASAVDEEKIERIDRLVKETTEDFHLTPVNRVKFPYLSIVGNNAVKDGELKIKEKGRSSAFVGDKYIEYIFVPLNDIEKRITSEIKLNKNQVYVFMKDTKFKANTVALGHKKYSIKKIKPVNLTKKFGAEDLFNKVYVILPDMKELKWLSADVFKRRTFSYQNNFDLKADRKKQLAYCEVLTKKSKALNLSVQGVEASRKSFYILYGGIFFTGILLGTIFLAAVVLIIYYKQLIEGYEDRKRYEIMRRVGMSDEEVRHSIKSQIFVIFAIPIVMAGIHLTFAFSILRNLLSLFGLTDTNLFIGITVGVYSIFAVIYLAVYALTSKVYYGMVSEQ